MKLFQKLTFIIVLLAISLSPTFSKDVVKVVTTLSDLGSLVKEIGGDKVDVESLVKGTQDPHHIEVLPSYMVKLRRADLFVMVGMDLDIWAFPLRDGSRNARLVVVDCSKYINRLEIPTQKVDASQGDIHLYGNPHYWLDPENGKLILRSIFEGLVQVSPENTDFFKANMTRFTERLDQKIVEWQAKMEPFKGVRMVFFHNSWPYFAHRFGIEAANFIEPKPGIQPSPSHTATVIKQIKEQNVPIIAIEPFFDRRVPDMISRQTGAKVYIFPTSVGGVPEVTDYPSLFDYLINTITKAL